ncbi:MAG: hypothetical protein AAF217_12575 [Pseudomonadota bacterium]
MNNQTSFSQTSSTVVMFIVTFFLMLFFATILQQIGAPALLLAFIMLILVVGLYFYCGLVTRTVRFGEFTRSGRAANPFFVGMALASGTISASIFVLLPGETYSGGVDFLATFHGMLLGLALMTVMFAAPISRSKEETIPALLFGRSTNKLFTFFTLCIVIASSLFLLIVQLRLLEDVVIGFFPIAKGSEIPFVIAVLVICLILGGMTAMTLSRILVFPVLLFAIFAPLIWISIEATGNPFPHISFGTGAQEAIKEIDREMLSLNLASQEEIFDITSEGTKYDTFNYITTLLCIAFGMAAMPHLLQHFTIVRKGSDSRRAGLWAFGFVFLILSAIPAIALFTKLDIYTSLLGLQISKLESAAGWLFVLSGGGSIPLIKICEEFVSNMQEVMQACEQSSDYFIALKDIQLNKKLLTLAFVTLHELPLLLAVMIATGALLAIMSTADGLIFAIANTTTQDGYHRLINPKAPKLRRLFIFRFVLVLLAGLAILIGRNKSYELGFLFDLSFVLLASSLFPALVVRLWIKNSIDGIICFGMFCGTFVSMTLIYITAIGPDFIPLTGDETVIMLPGVTETVLPISNGIFGLVVNFISMAFAYLAMRLYSHSFIKEAENAGL